MRCSALSDPSHLLPKRTLQMTFSTALLNVSPNSKPSSFVSSTVLITWCSSSCIRSSMDRLPTPKSLMACIVTRRTRRHLSPFCSATPPGNQTMFWHTFWNFNARFCNQMYRQLPRKGYIGACTFLYIVCTYSILIEFCRLIPSPCRISNLIKSRCNGRSDQTSAFSTSASFMMARSVTTSVGTWASCMSETRVTCSEQEVLVLHRHSWRHDSDFIIALIIDFLLKSVLHSCKCTLLTEEPAILLAPLVCDDVKLLAFSDQA